jgi:hypothetical protein
MQSSKAMYLIAINVVSTIVAMVLAKYIIHWLPKDKN